MRHFLAVVSKGIIFFILTVLALYLLLALTALFAALFQVRRNAEDQDRRMSLLREKYSSSYTPSDEQRIASFSLSDASIRLNEVSFLATHNSYQPRAGWPYRTLLRALSLIPKVPVDGRLAGFEMDSLTEQLEHGIRSLELDVQAAGDGKFSVTHFLLDNRSSCQDFETALEELKLWSAHNPRHLPLIVLIEPKEIEFAFGNRRPFDAECAIALDGVIRSVMGDLLLTPGETVGEYDSFAAMRADDGWPLLEDCRGRVLFVLHPCSVTEDYIERDRTVRTQAMFPCLRYGGIHEEYASFILDNNPNSVTEHPEEAALRLMVRTRADDYPDFSGERYADADRCGAQIVTTDFPPRDSRAEEHTYSFDGYTVRLSGNAPHPEN